MGGVSRPSVTPEHLHSDAYAPVEDLRQLGKECQERRISEQSRLLLARLASYPPNVRLIINLKRLVGLMVNGPIYNVLTEGLTPAEHAALAELDIKGLTSRSREVAHGLLNIHERWRVMKDIRRMVKRASEARERFIIIKPKEEDGQEKEETVHTDSTA